MRRRDFFKTAAAAAAAAGAMTSDRMDLFAQAPARPQVTIDGRRIKVVDVHQHWDMPLPLEIVKGTPFEDRAKGPGLDERVAMLDKFGIDMAIISVNDFWWWETKDQGLAKAICSFQNETLATWHKRHPDRLFGMASVPLQFLDVALEMMQDAVARLGARGIAVGGHVNGESLSMPKYDAFWAKAVEMGQLVFMHPNGATNIIKEGGLAGRGGLGNIVGNPLETTVFLSRLIFDGTFDKFPTLKVGAAHAAGYLPSYLGRTEIACQRPGQTCTIKRKPSEYLRSNILADTMVFSEEGLRHLVAEMGGSQVVFGTDIPFNWPVNVNLVADAPSLSNADKEAILGGTLIRLLKLPA